MEVIPFTQEFPGKNMLDKLEFIQRRSIRAILDAPFAVANEILEYELGFCKTIQYL